MVGTLSEIIREEKDVMSLSNGSAENPGDPWLPGPEGEPSPYAPKWVRDGHAHPGKVVSLRMPPAPHLPPPRGPPPAASRPRNLDLADDDAALHRLMQRPTPEPPPPVEA